MSYLPQSWEDIVERYMQLEEQDPTRVSMINLVKHIRNSDLRDSLYPWSSMYDLLLTQRPRHPFQNEPHLRITPLHDGRAEFRYVDTFVKSKQWSRVAEPLALEDRFESVVQQLHWRVKTL